MVHLRNFNRVRNKFGIKDRSQVVSEFSNRLQKIICLSPLKSVYTGGNEYSFDILIKASARHAPMTSIAETIAERLLTPFAVK